MAQTWKPQHFYIIDDCSSDNSVELLKQWNKANNNVATIIVHEKNQGITSTMNHALSLCNTKYFQPWPCDDLMLPHKTESQITYLESLDWEPGFLYGDIEWIDNDDKLLRKSVIADRRELFPNKEMPSGFIFPELARMGCFIPTASGMYVTQALKDVGGFDEGLFAEDWDMFMRIALKRGIAFQDNLVSRYRRHSGSAEMKKGERYWQGHFKILPKYLGINKDYDKIIYDKMGRDALEAYNEGAKGYEGLILKAFFKNFNYKLLSAYFRAKVKRVVYGRKNS
jgi:glycosyltransferase involved in cell wall biosynthesis